MNNRLAKLAYIAVAALSTAIGQVVAAPPVEPEAEPRIENSKTDTLLIKNVSLTPPEFADGESIKIKFTLPQKANVEVRLYDPQDFLIGRIPGGDFAAGDQTLLWDGKDISGADVPAGTYRYVIEAKSGEDKIIYDLTDVTGGATVPVEGIKYNKETQELSFQVLQPSMVLLRAGIRDGMLLKTLVNAQAYGVGPHSLKWDGWDESRVIKLGAHPRLSFAAESWRLPVNTILVSREKPVAKWQRPSQERRDSSNIPDGRNVHFYYERVGGRDPQINLTPLVPSNENQVVALNAPTDFRVDVAPIDLEFMNTQRYEAVFFLNGEMLYENETAYSPFTWRWDPTALPKGEHILTAVISTFSGYFGTASIRFTTAGAAQAEKTGTP